MTKVSKNEIMLLIVMILGIAIYAGYYLVKIPLDEEYALVEEEVRTKEAELMEAQRRIATKADLEVAYVAAIDDLEDIKTRIVTYMHEEDLDDRMVALMEANQVATKTVSIANDAGSSVASDIQGITYKGYSITVFGTQDNVYAFINSIYDQTDMAVVSVNITRVEEMEDEDMEALGIEIEMQCSINIVVCMEVEE